MTTDPMTGPPIVAFLKARLAEDESAARSTAAEGVDNVLWRVWAGALDARAYLKEEGGTEEDYVRMQENQFARAKQMLALGDPARALREIEAKRRVMARHKRPDRERTSIPNSCDGCGSHMEWGDLEPDTPDINDCPELRDLAAVYSDHPDFREEWAA